jgi:hypothetical protein
LPGCTAAATSSKLHDQGPNHHGQKNRRANQFRETEQKSQPIQNRGASQSRGRASQSRGRASQSREEDVHPNVPVQEEEAGQPVQMNKDDGEEEKERQNAHKSRRHTSLQIYNATSRNGITYYQYTKHQDNRHGEK